MAFNMILIKKLYKSIHKKTILSDINLKIYHGEIFCIVGKSGSGKSVFLKHLIGLLKPDRGEIFIDQENIVTMKEKNWYAKLQEIGMIFQMSALFDFMTIGENISFHLQQHLKIKNKKIPSSTMKNFVTQALRKVGLQNIEHLYPKDLSGGMKKQVAIARCIIYQPKYLFYDEPTSGLDPITAKLIAKLICHQQDALRGTTIIVSHDVPTILGIADRIALLDKGKIIFVAKPKDFMKFDHPMVHLFHEITCSGLKIIGKIRNEYP